MSNVINIEDIKKDKINNANNDNTPSSRQEHIDKIKLVLNTYLKEKFPDISEPVEINVTLYSEEESISITTLIMHYTPDEKPIHFDEWVLDQKDMNITVNGIEHTKSNITPFAFGVFINDLGNDGIIVASLLQILCGINTVCLDVNKKAIASPIFKKVDDAKVYGINYVLESDNKDTVVLVVTITRTFN